MPCDHSRMRQTAVTAIVKNRVVVGGDSVDAAVPWWSFTKTVMASAALALVDQGRLTLDDPVEGWPFTLRHLLQHRAGLRCYGVLPDYHAAVARGDPAWPAAEMLERVSAGDLLFAPGTGWAYSNVGYYFIRRLIEASAQSDFETALRGLVLTPAGASETFLAESRRDHQRCAWPARTAYDPGWVYHGLLVGPAREAALFLDHLLGGFVLPAPLLGELTRPRILGEALPGRPWQRHGYGLGLMVGEMEPAGPCAGHTGQGPHSTAAVYRFTGMLSPVTVAVFAPASDEGDAERTAADIASRYLP